MEGFASNWKTPARPDSSAIHDGTGAAHAACPPKAGPREARDSRGSKSISPARSVTTETLETIRSAFRNAAETGGTQPALVADALQAADRRYPR
jgi:hypothetical protein